MPRAQRVLDLIQVFRGYRRPVSGAVPAEVLGLWSRNSVEPAATASPGASEVAFTFENTAAVEATFADWKKRGLTILQEPVRMDFGTTFVATDPDGHRLRVFVPEAA